MISATFSMPQKGGFKSDFFEDNQTGVASYTNPTD